MSRRYDVAVIGGGLNGLVTAAYVAKAGKSVVLLEKQENVGGAIGTIEIAPGFRAPVAFDSMETLHPSISNDLRLESHGLRPLRGGGVFLPRENGAALHLDSRFDVAGQIASVDQRDAAAWSKFEGFVSRVGKAIEKAISRPLPDPVPSGLGDVMDLLQLGWPLRSLGRDEMPEALRFVPMPIKDVVDEHFNGEAVKAMLSAVALTGSWAGPRYAGSAFGLLYHRPSWVAGLVPATIFAEGSMSALAEAIANSARAAGAQIRTNAEVRSIDVAGKRVRGITLAGGETIEASFVASALDPRRTFLGLTGATWLEPEFVEKVGQVRGRGAVSVIRFALDRVPEFGGASRSALSGRIQIGESVDGIERAFDDAKYGRVPSAPLLTATIPSITDPSLAPDGKHVMSVWAQFTPHTLRDAEWGEKRNELGDRVVSMIESHSPGFTSSIVAREVDTPADLEERLGITNGCLYHVEMALDQLLYMRPIPGWFRYGTPIEGLYLCGPGTHPGGGVTGLPGKCAAAEIVRRSK